jgi:hypothetical protein
MGATESMTCLIGPMLRWQWWTIQVQARVNKARQAMDDS